MAREQASSPTLSSPRWPAVGTIVLATLVTVASAGLFAGFAWRWLARDALSGRGRPLRTLLHTRPGEGGALAALLALPVTWGGLIVSWPLIEELRWTGGPWSLLCSHIPALLPWSWRGFEASAAFAIVTLVLLLGWLFACHRLLPTALLVGEADVDPVGTSWRRAFVVHIGISGALGLPALAVSCWLHGRSITLLPVGLFGVALLLAVLAPGVGALASLRAVLAHARSVDESHAGAALTPGRRAPIVIALATLVVWVAGVRKVVSEVADPHMSPAEVADLAPRAAPPSSGRFERVSVDSHDLAIGGCFRWEAAFRARTELGVLTFCRSASELRLWTQGAEGPTYWFREVLDWEVLPAAVFVARSERDHTVLTAIDVRLVARTVTLGPTAPVWIAASGPDRVIIALDTAKGLEIRRLDSAARSHGATVLLPKLPGTFIEAVPTVEGLYVSVNNPVRPHRPILLLDDDLLPRRPLLGLAIARLGSLMLLLPLALLISLACLAWWVRAGRTARALRRGASVVGLASAPAGRAVCVHARSGGSITIELARAHLHGFDAVGSIGGVCVLVGEVAPVGPALYRDAPARVRSRRVDLFRGELDEARRIAAAERDRVLLPATLVAACATLLPVAAALVLTV